MEIKKQIIESKLPPSNKEVWWFDVNTNTLKRYTRNKWSLFNAIPFDIPMPDSHTIVYLCSGEMDLMGEDIKNSFDANLFGGIASCTVTNETIFFNEWDYMDFKVCRVTFNDSVILTENISTVPTSIGEWVYTIKYPGNIVSIPYYSIRIEGCITPAIVLGENVKYISGEAIYSYDSIESLICLAQYPPVLDSSSLVITDNGPDPSIEVYVPDEVVSLYERATNWSYFTIKPLSKYASLPILKQF